MSSSRSPYGTFKLPEVIKLFWKLNFLYNGMMLTIYYKDLQKYFKKYYRIRASVSYFKEAILVHSAKRDWSLPYLHGMALLGGEDWWQHLDS